MKANAQKKYNDTDKKSILLKSNRDPVIRRQTTMLRKLKRRGDRKDGRTGKELETRPGPT